MNDLKIQICIAHLFLTVWLLLFFIAVAKSVLNANTNADITKTNVIENGEIGEGTAEPSNDENGCEECETKTSVEIQEPESPKTGKIKE